MKRIEPGRYESYTEDGRWTIERLSSELDDTIELWYVKDRSTEIGAEHTYHEALDVVKEAILHAHSCPACGQIRRVSRKRRQLHANPLLGRQLESELQDVG